MKIKDINLFLILLLLDLGSKALAVYIAPSNSFFVLTYNQNMTLGLKPSAGLLYLFPNSSLGDLVNTIFKFIIPLFVIPFVWKFSQITELTRSQKHLTLSFVVAGMVGNYASRFHSMGVIDFIYFKYFVANFADFYLWIGTLLAYKYLYSESKKSLQKTNKDIK